MFYQTGAILWMVAGLFENKLVNSWADSDRNMGSIQHSVDQLVNLKTNDFVQA